MNSLDQGIIEALRDPFLGAQHSDAVLATQTVQHDPDLFFS